MKVIHLTGYGLVWMAWVDATAAEENATINLRAYWVATRKAAEVSIWCNRTQKGNLANKINNYKVRNNDNIVQIMEIKHHQSHLLKQSRHGCVKNLWNSGVPQQYGNNILLRE